MRSTFHGSFGDTTNDIASTAIRAETYRAEGNPFDKLVKEVSIQDQTTMRGVGTRRDSIFKSEFDEDLQN